MRVDHHLPITSSTHLLVLVRRGLLVDQRLWLRLGLLVDQRLGLRLWLKLDLPEGREGLLVLVWARILVAISDLRPILLNLFAVTDWLHTNA